MLYNIVSDGSVLLGPMPWRKFYFENTLLEDLDMQVELPLSDPQTAYTVSDTVYILPVEMADNPQCNERTEFLHGPFWNIQTDDAGVPAKAIGSYTVENYTVEAIQNKCKAIVAANRYQREIAGIVVNIGGRDVIMPTDRDSRSMVVQTYLLQLPSVDWKFDNGFITVTHDDLGTIVQAGAQYVQDAFTWEAQKIAEIEAATTIDALAALVLDYQ